jgi:hypothetical protein
MTHADLVHAAYRWLLGPAGCGFAFRELVAINGTGEIPDVLGYKDGGKHTIIVECKTSRPDFLSDRKKRHRRGDPACLPMGRYRFYATPKGMLSVEELPERWGLIEANERSVMKLRHNPYNMMGGNWWSNGFEEHNIEAERAMMYSALRRLHMSGHVETIYQSPFKKHTAVL